VVAAAEWLIGSVIDLAVEDACVLCRGRREPVDLQGPGVDLVSPVRHPTFFGRLEMTNHPVCGGCAERLPAARFAGVLGRWARGGVFRSSRDERERSTGEAASALDGPGGSGGQIRVISPFMVDDNILKIVHLLKFSGYQALSVPMARSITRAARDWGFSPGPRDVVVPVPMDPRSLKRRGFNQSERIARSVAGLLGLPIRGDVLEKQRSTRPQSKTPAEQRAANVRDAFTCPGSIAGLRIILIDDLVTTGATAASCASALLGSGAGDVAVLCFGRAL
jgi:ComF family protein